MVIPALMMLSGPRAGTPSVVSLCEVDVVSAVAASLLLVAVVAFQLAVVLGAPVGRFTQGGQHEGRLPTANRVLAALSIVLLLAMAATVSGKVGRGPFASLSSGLLTTMWWITVAYLAVGLVMNLASRSKQERLVFAPLTAIVLVLVLMSVAEFKDHSPGDLGCAIGPCLSSFWDTRQQSSPAVKRSRRAA